MPAPIGLHDPSRKLRLLNLRFLAAPETNAPPQLLASTARALLGDPYLPLRVLAAAQLGAEGHAVLRALAADSQLEQELRVSAVQALFDTQLRQAARAAVGSIQSRLGDVEAGRVSLTEPRELAGGRRAGGRWGHARRRAIAERGQRAAGTHVIAALTRTKKGRSRHPLCRVGLRRGHVEV